MRKSPHSLRHLNTCFRVNGAVWGGLEGAALLKQYPWGQGLTALLGVPFLHCVLAVQDVSLLLPATMPVTCCHVLPIVTESDSLGPQALVRVFYHSEIVTNTQDEPLLSASQEQNLTVKGW